MVRSTPCIHHCIIDPGGGRADGHALDARGATGDRRLLWAAGREHRRGAQVPASGTVLASIPPLCHQIVSLAAQEGPAPDGRLKSDVCWVGQDLEKQNMVLCDRFLSLFEVLKARLDSLESGASKLEDHCTGIHNRRVGTELCRKSGTATTPFAASLPWLVTAMHNHDVATLWLHAIPLQPTPTFEVDEPRVVYLSRT